jgi:hypothetical protein
MLLAIKWFCLATEGKPQAYASTAQGSSHRAPLGPRAL